MDKIKLELTLLIDKQDKTIEDVFNDIKIIPDDVVDGFLITRRGRLGDVTEDFYIQDVEVESMEVEGDE